MNKKFLALGGLLLTMSLASCAGNNNSNAEPASEPASSASVSSKDTTDYGRVYFKPVYIYADAYGNNFDEVMVEPIFSKPEVCGNEVFEYEIADDSVCYIENDYVYATGVTGSTKVTAKSQHLKGTFYVYCEDHYANAQAFATAKSLANKAEKATNQGTTLFIGDSFFEFWRNKTGIDESFATAFAGYDVANAGISGTQAREWRSLVHKLVDPYEPTNIVLNIGINDVDDNSEDGASTAGYIMSLCNHIWAKHPDCNIYYCSITRCAGYFAGKWPAHNASNEIMQSNAASYDKLHYLDIMAVWGDNYASYEQSDGLHPNTAGYEVFKTVIQSNVPLVQK